MRFRTFYLITFIIFYTTTIFAFDIKGVGKAVIVNDDLKTAEITARNSALIDALSNYFVLNNSIEDIPDINEEFFKFIKKYTILNRKVENFTVYYEVIATIDEVAINDANYLINNITHSVIYIFENDDLDSDLKTAMKKQLSQILSEYNFSIKYQEDFEIITPDNLNFEDKLSNFGNSKAKYFFTFNLSPECSTIDNGYFCKLTTILKIYTKKETLPTIKTITSSLDKTEIDAISDAFKKASENILKYIKSNLIKSEQEKSADKTYNITFINFKTIANLNKLLNFLKEKGFINNYTLKSYSISQATFELTTKFSQERLSEKIVTYDNKVSIETENGDIIITFL